MASATNPPAPPPGTTSTDATATSPMATRPPPGYTAAYLTQSATTVALRSLTWTAFGGFAGAAAATIRYDPYVTPFVAGSRGVRGAFLAAFPFYGK